MEENFIVLMNEFTAAMKEFNRAVRKASGEIRSLRGKVRHMDADQFNENPEDVVEAFYRNYERIDNIRQACRMAQNNIKRLEKLPYDED